MSTNPSHVLRGRESVSTTKTKVPISEIESAVRDIRHGTVQIIIQDGAVVQIDRTEKLRLR